jgi:hypothetical protein
MVSLVHGWYRHVHHATDVVMPKKQPEEVEVFRKALDEQMELVVTLRDGKIYISYESPAALDEPPYWDQSFWEPYDHGFDAPLMRYDWSDIWVWRDMGASMTIEEWEEVTKALRKHMKRYRRALQNSTT